MNEDLIQSENKNISFKSNEISKEFIDNLFKENQELRERNRNNEHLIIQLENETNTIGIDFIFLFFSFS